MTRSLMFYILLLLVHVPDRTDCHFIDRIQHRDKSFESNNGGVLARCAKRATSTLFEPANRIVSIVDDEHSSTATNYLKILSTDLNSVTLVSSILGDGTKILNPSTWSNAEGGASYVIISSNFENLSEIFQSGKMLSIWSEYLIVTRIDQDSLHTFASSLLQRGYLRFAILHMKNDDNSIALYSYEDLSRDSMNYYEDYPKLKRVATCDTSSEDSRVDIFNNEIEPFSSKLCPMRGCSLAVVHVKDDMVGSPAIAKIRRNFDCAENLLGFFIDTQHMRLKKSTNNEENLNWTKTLELLEHDEIDVAYGNFIPRSEGFNGLDVATWYDFETLTFFDVLQFTAVASPTKIFVPLDAYIWTCLITLLAVYLILAVIIERIHRRQLIKDSMKIFDIWAVLLSQRINPPANGGLRVVLGMWMLAVMCTNFAYESAFSGSLATFMSTNSLKTLFDLNKSGRPIAGTAVARELFNNSDDQTDRDIYAKWRVVEPEEVFRVVTEDRVVGTDYLLNMKFYNLYKQQEFQHHLHVLEEQVLVHPLNFYLKKNHPYVKPLRRLVARARAADLIDKWQFWKRNNTMEQTRSLYYDHKHKYCPKNFNDMSVSFKVWGIGILMSLIVLLYEIYTSRRADSLINMKNYKIPRSLTNDVKSGICYLCEKICRKKKPDAINHQTCSREG